MSETLEHRVITPIHLPSRSATFFKTAALFLRSAPAPEPAIEPANEPAPAPEPTPSAPSVISARSEMTGAINTPEELLVQGKIEGDIRASKIVVCPGGVVKGGLTADVIVIHGVVEGRVEGRDVLLCGSAVVSGEITHRTLGIDTTAAFEGEVKRAKADAIAAE
jgi:cytoskeletal protein CcmA (bactofilin family)